MIYKSSLRRKNIVLRSEVILNNYDKGASLELSEGDLYLFVNTASAGTYRMVRATIPCSDIPRYFEQEFLTYGTTRVWIGAGTSAASLTTYPGATGQPSIGYYGSGSNGQVYYNGSYVNVSNYAVGDFLGLGYDPQRKIFYFYKNGVLIREDTRYSPSGPIFPLVGGSNQGRARVAFSRRQMRYGPPAGFSDWEEA